MPQLSQTARAVCGRESVFDLLFSEMTERALLSYIRKRRWFQGKAKKPRQAKVTEAARLGSRVFLLFVEVSYAEGPPETYFIPSRLKLCSARDESDTVVCVYAGENGRSVALVDGARDKRALQMFSAFMRSDRTVHTAASGKLHAECSTAARSRWRTLSSFPQVHLLRAEQSNTSVVIGGAAMLKFYRRLSPGENPEVEVGRYLSENTSFASTPATWGWCKYRSAAGEQTPAAVVQEYVPNEGDCWDFAVASLEQAYRTLSDQELDRFEYGRSPESLLPTRAEAERLSASLGSLSYLPKRLGEMTAELHQALGQDTGDARFAPEPAAPAYFREIAGRIISRADRALTLLARRLDDIAAIHQGGALVLLEQSAAVADFVRRSEMLLSGAAARGEIALIRCHGDYHLGQVLRREGKLLVYDFEGEPLAPPPERLRKHSPLKDAAGMVRSLDYAAHTAAAAAAGPSPADYQRSRLSRTARFWSQALGGVFLFHYRSTLAADPMLCPDSGIFEELLRLLLFDKAFYELEYELSFRPDWVHIPASGLVQLLSEAALAPKAGRVRAVPAAEATSSERKREGNARR